MLIILFQSYTELYRHLVLDLELGVLSWGNVVEWDMDFLSVLANNGTMPLIECTTRHILATQTDIEPCTTNHYK